jgi:hypothetical protein
LCEKAVVFLVMSLLLVMWLPKIHLLMMQSFFPYLVISKSHRRSTSARNMRFNCLFSHGAGLSIETNSFELLCCFFIL